MTSKIVAIDRLVCRHVPSPWPWAEAEAARIDAHWQRQVTQNPSLYDGIVLLARNVEITGKTLSMDFFDARFSRFLAWRDFGAPDRSVYNAFSMPALRSSDGAFLLGEMAQDHSCAGQLYFPAGTPDAKDLVDGRVDLEGSLLRELAEEAGLAAHKDALSPGWRVVIDAQRIACMKMIDWRASAADIATAVAAHILADRHPELAAAHMIFRRAQIDEGRMPQFMQDFLRLVLAE